MAETEVLPLAKDFFNDVRSGLSQCPKKLSSKYLYDVKGDELFQQIMQLPEYYLTRCEMDIFKNKTEELALSVGSAPFDLIELGAGDGTKSMHLLKHLQEKSAEFTFIPIDISGNILKVLETKVKAQIPAINIQCLKGDYFEMLTEAVQYSTRRKVVLLLGGNIGNMTAVEAENFCSSLFKALSPGDRVIIGFDLKKHPKTILNAYDDSQGITAAFNLNLLVRINRELGANFELDQFEHYQSYNPENGECRSYLVSLYEQTVNLQNSTIRFMENETIFMEVSRKFSPDDINLLAQQTGFTPVGRIMDSKEWFADAVWEILE
ncbi:MAG: L-histidine N(alpha)-methyltransferase [Pedobacter sp.]|nr:MAG: L-histidine N(alpha)-methyltransferase [Pedobacter sp.]